jgi:hypothetical protein
MERRLDRIERGLGGRDDACGPLALIAPNSWSDADRAAWERAQIVHDEDVESALIEKYAGHPVRPCRHARRHFTIIVVPAPQHIEDADEATRAAWRARRS